MAKCPEGTLCISPTFAGVIVLCFILLAYLCYSYTYTRPGASDTSRRSKQRVTAEETEAEVSPTLATSSSGIPSLRHTENGVAAVGSRMMHAAPPTVAAPVIVPPSKATMVPTINHNYTTATTTNVFAPHDPLLTPPMRRDPNLVVGVPINIPTRGTTPDVQQVGILTNTENDQVLALYGRPTFRGSHKWMYYSATDKFHALRLPISNGSRNCTGEFGCDEVSDGDELTIPTYPDRKFKVTVYNMDAPRYIPFV